MMSSMRRILAAGVAFLLCGTIEAGPRGGGAARGGAQSSVTRGSGGGSHSANAASSRSSNANQNRNTNVNQNVNRNTNINQNTNVNIDRDVDVDVHGGYGGVGGCCYNNPVAKAAVVTAAVATTAAVVGAIFTPAQMPPSCVPADVNGITYQQCGSTWYQPQYSGSSVTYVVVNQP